MKTIRFGRTGATVSAISLGTWSHGGARTIDGREVGWSGGDDDEARRALVAAREVGINHWDTADAYGGGRAERLIGGVWGEVPRDEILLATKVGWYAGEFDHYYQPGLIRRQLELSLRQLRTDRIDLYYLHHCDFGPDDRYLDAAVDLLRRFRDEGKVRWLGLSDWDAGKLARLVPTVDPDVVQPYRNLLEDDYEASGLRALVDARDLGVAFFSPLKHGLLLGKYRRPPSFDAGDVRNGVEAFSDQELLDHLRRCRAAVEARFGERPEPVLSAVLGALLTDAPTGCVLLGMRNPAQARAAGAADVELSVEETAWLTDLYRSAS